MDGNLCPGFGLFGSPKPKGNFIIVMSRNFSIRPNITLHVAVRNASLNFEKYLRHFSDIASWKFKPSNCGSHIKKAAIELPTYNLPMIAWELLQLRLIVVVFLLFALLSTFFSVLLFVL
jgi:hypothetical protein